MINLEEFFKDLKCPECESSTHLYESVCYDPYCCGIDDRLFCSAELCFWEHEGQFSYMDEDELKWESITTEHKTLHITHKKLVEFISDKDNLIRDKVYETK